MKRPKEPPARTARRFGLRGWNEQRTSTISSERLKPSANYGSWELT